MEFYTLSNNVKIPVIGFGTWQTPNDDTGVNAVLSALKAGYRHIDTAQGYGNESAVGKAVKLSGIPRGDIYCFSFRGHRHFSQLVCGKRLVHGLRLVDTRTAYGTYHCRIFVSCRYRCTESKTA